jgi:hypothetical protein
MDVGRSTTSLGKMGIFHSIQELAMARMSDHVSSPSSIMNSSVEGTSWSNGCMDLLQLKYFSKGLGSEDVDLNMSHRFRAFMCHLSPEVILLPLISQFLQHLPDNLRDLARITSIMLELANISV